MRSLAKRLRKSVVPTIALVTALLGEWSFVFAETKEAAGEIPLAGEMGTASLKMFGSLALVIGLIICLFYFLRRLRLPVLSNAKFPEMRVVGTLNVAPKRAIALVEVCNQWFLLGVGVESVTLLSTIDEPEGWNRTESGMRENRKGFHSLLQRKIRWFREAGERSAKKDDLV